MWISISKTRRINLNTALYIEAEDGITSIVFPRMDVVTEGLSIGWAMTHTTHNTIITTSHDIVALIN